MLNIDGLTTVEVSVAIAEKAARLRSQYSLRTPDAIQIATALHTGASALLTNDIRWPALPDVHILTLEQLV
ncbi:MAG: PIN domain-containing protein [Candidatus Electrothrix sp.]